MDTFRTKLLRQQVVAEGTAAFHFAKPSGFQFRAGQFVDVTLIDPPETDAAGSTRTFTLASAPFENELMVTTRLRDTAFKRVLSRLSPDDEVMIEGPMGSFTLHSNAAKPAVFLAGGIGITPFFSIAKEAAHQQLAHQIDLFYSNRRPASAAFLDVLTELEARNPRFRLTATMTDLDPSSGEWGGETGFIDAAMLNRHLDTLQGPIFSVAGPPEMVEAMRQMLLNAGVDPDDIRAEEFAGY